MAKPKKNTDSANSFKIRTKKKNKGVHSKCKSSSLKSSKNYRKLYAGQGR